MAKDRRLFLIIPFKEDADAHSYYALFFYSLILTEAAAQEAASEKNFVLSD